MKRILSWCVLGLSFFCLMFFWIGVIKMANENAGHSGLSDLFPSSKASDQLKMLISGYFWDAAPDKNSSPLVWAALFVIASFGPSAHASLKQEKSEKSTEGSASTKQSYLL